MSDRHRLRKPIYQLKRAGIGHLPEEPSLEFVELLVATAAECLAFPYLEVF